MSRAPKLAPCPFCGEPPEIADLGDPSSRYIRCGNLDCMVDCHTNTRTSFARQVEAWNQRAKIQALVEAVADILESPRWLEPATVPAAGIAANPMQVVFNASESYIKVKALEDAYAAWEKQYGREYSDRITEPAPTRTDQSPAGGTGPSTPTT